MKDREIEAVVADLQQVDRQAGWGRVLRIGEIIITRLYGGDREACRQPKRRAISIRRIAEHPSCPFRKSRLAEAIGVYLLCEDMPRIRTFGHVGPSHVAAVLSLPADRRAELLERAEGEQWTVRRLREEVVELHRLAGERRGRPRRNSGDPAEQEIRTAVLALNRARTALEATQPKAALLGRVRQALRMLTGDESPAGRSRVWRSRRSQAPLVPPRRPACPR